MKKTHMLLSVVTIYKQLNLLCISLLVHSKYTIIYEWKSIDFNWQSTYYTNTKRRVASPYHKVTASTGSSDTLPTKVANRRSVTSLENTCQEKFAHSIL